MKAARFIIACTVLTFLSLSVKAQQESAQTQSLPSKRMVVKTAPTPSPTVTPKVVQPAAPVKISKVTVAGRLRNGTELVPTDAALATIKRAHISHTWSECNASNL